MSTLWKDRFEKATKNIDNNITKSLKEVNKKLKSIDSTDFSGLSKLYMQIVSKNNPSLEKYKKEVNNDLKGYENFFISLEEIKLFDKKISEDLKNYKISKENLDITLKYYLNVKENIDIIPEKFSDKNHDLTCKKIFNNSYPLHIKESMIEFNNPLLFIDSRDKYIFSKGHLLASVENVNIMYLRVMVAKAIISHMDGKTLVKKA